MKKIKLILICIFLIIFITGCKAEEDNAYNTPSLDAVTEVTDAPSEEDNSEKPEDEYIDINSVADADTDYDKYDMEPDKKITEKKVTEKKVTEKEVTEEKAGKKKSILDKYNTEPVPEGKPEPVEPEDAVIDKEDVHTCTLTIDCKTILDNMDDFDDKKTGILPKDGIILEKTEVTYSSGESVFDILLRETKNRHIHMEYSFTPLYNSSYIEGIANLYEYDCGELSGWMYLVNGWSPNYGLSRYQVSDGDNIEIRYTCDLGADL